MRDTTEGRVRRIRLLIKFVWISTGKNEPAAIRNLFLSCTLYFIR